jgi:hypothetical protein
VANARKVQPAEGVTVEGLLAKRFRKRWKDWKSSSVEPVESVLEAIEVDDIPNVALPILSDDLDRRSKALMSWAPWARRVRYSRRYEGFRPSY